MSVLQKIVSLLVATRLDFDLLPETDLHEEDIMKEYEDLMSQGGYQVTYPYLPVF